ncbi:hypothetical protein AB0M29_44390 [Streptomyces sp. NPDC051976]|uniref:hypothetical protein n=1 Tax=Streptomyces sp. NPDC051976 TaxID=3154947 RepID=UPI00343B66A4
MDLVRRYSNHPEVAADLVASLKALHAERGRVEVGRVNITSTGRAPSRGRVVDKLSDEQVSALIGEFHAGTIRKELAAKYGISLSSVTRLLRKHGARLSDQST